MWMTISHSHGGRNRSASFGGDFGYMNTKSAALAMARRIDDSTQVVERIAQNDTLALETFRSDTGLTIHVQAVGWQKPDPDKFLRMVRTNLDWAVF